MAKGEVDLVIRAKNEATKNLDAINKALKSLSDQQTIVGDSATQTDGKLAQLSVQLAQLRTNAQNLKSLSSIEEVLDGASRALSRQREAAEDAGKAAQELGARQQDLADKNRAASTGLAESSAELTRQQALLKTAKAELSALNKTTTSLTTAEARLERQLATAAQALVKRQAAVAEAAEKQNTLSTAISQSEKVTKAQQTSLQAATTALTRRQQAVEETVAKEAALKQALEQNRATGVANAQAVTRAAQALESQAASTQAAKDAVARYKTEVNGLTTAQRSVATEMTKAEVVLLKQKAALDAVQAEYGQVKEVADKAKAAIAEQGVATTDSGNAAAKTAVQVAVLAARMTALAGSKSAGKQVTIIDPATVSSATAAIRTMSVTINAAGNAAAKASVSGEELATALKDTEQSVKQLENVRDTLKRQEGAIDGSKRAWQAAQAEVHRLAKALKEAGQPSDELAAAFGRSQAAARTAKTEYLAQAAAAAQNATALQSVGVGSGSVASAQSALATRIAQANEQLRRGRAAASEASAGNNEVRQSASSAAPVVKRLVAALGELADTSKKAGNSHVLIGRLRSELVGMASAAVGLYAIKEQLESIWQVGANLEALKAQFTTAFGSVEEGSRELEYARQVALNLKLPIDALTASYADLALSAKGTSLEGEKTKSIFEGFAQVARVNQSSVAELEGVYLALTQIMSKGVVQLEELRGQLGDRLPGALQIMADGIGVNSEKLYAMVEAGELSRESLLNMAAEASGRVAPALAQALDSPAAKLADFQNRLVIFKETIAGSGFLDAVADVFEQLAQVLSSPEGLEGARQLGAALADIIRWATELAQSGHLETIGNAFVLLASSWAALKVGSIITGLYSLTAGLGAFTIGVLALDVALSPILVGLGALAAVVATVAAAFGSWYLAKWAYENFEGFGTAVLKLKSTLTGAFDVMVTTVQSAASLMIEHFARFVSYVPRTVAQMLSSVLSTFNSFFEAVGLDGFAATSKQLLDGLNDYADKRFAEGAEYRAGLEEGLLARRMAREKKLADEIAAYRAKHHPGDPIDGSTGAARRTASTGNTSLGLSQITAPDYVPSTAKADAKEAAKAATARVSLEKSVASQMYAIRAALEKKSAQTLDEKLAAVPAKYAKLYDQLRALGQNQASEDWKAVDALVAQEQQLIRIKHAKEQAAAADRQARKEEAAENKSRAQAMQYIETLLKTRKNLQEQLARAKSDGDVGLAGELEEKIAAISLTAAQAIESMRRFWEAVGGPDADAAIAKIDALGLQLTKTKGTGILTAQSIGNAFTNNLSNSLDGFISKIAETGDIMGSLKDAFLDFAANFLIQIAQMILQQIVFNAISGALGGASTGASASSVPGLFHNGGTVGAGTQSRSGVNPAIFNNAVKYHGGGIAGLKSDEVPAILKVGEVVRTQEQEKALAARQAAAQGSAQAPQPIKIVNQIDSGDMVASGVGSAAGEKAVMNFISSNRGRIKSLLG